MPRPAWVGARLDIAADYCLPWVTQSRVDRHTYRVAAMACYRLVGCRFSLSLCCLSVSHVVSARDLRQRRAESAELTSGLASVCLSVYLAFTTTSIFLRTFRINVTHLRQSHPIIYHCISGCLGFALQPPYSTPADRLPAIALSDHPSQEHSCGVSPRSRESSRQDPKA
jgi:hypothetical protein